MSTDFRCRQCGHSKPQAASRCLNAECPISHISQPLRGVNRVTSASAPETHPNPQIAKSDGKNMLKLDKLENLLCSLIKIRKAIL